MGLRDVIDELAKVRSRGPQVEWDREKHMRQEFYVGVYPNARYRAKRTKQAVLLPEEAKCAAPTHGRSHPAATTRFDAGAETTGGAAGAVTKKKRRRRRKKGKVRSLYPPDALRGQMVEYTQGDFKLSGTREKCPPHPSERCMVKY